MRVNDKIKVGSTKEIIMQNSDKILVTREWLDWFQKIWYHNGIVDEKLRQIHAQLETERVAQGKQAAPKK